MNVDTDKATQIEVQFLGGIPVEIETRRASDTARPVMLKSPESKTAQAFVDIAKNVKNLLS